MNELIKKSKGEFIIDPQIAESIMEYEITLSEIKENEKKITKVYDDLKKALKAEMVRINCKELNANDENHVLIAKVIIPTDTEDFDKKRFSIEHPDLYAKYTRMKKSTPRLTVEVK